jgi:hypothetical protein
MSHFFCLLYESLLFLLISSLLSFSYSAGVPEVVRRKKYIPFLNNVSLGVPKSILKLFSLILLAIRFTIRPGMRSTSGWKEGCIINKLQNSDLKIWADINPI